MKHADDLPDAEAALTKLVERMAGAVASDAAFVGIYSGGAWLAERLAQRLRDAHPVGFIDVSYYRDDYALSGLKPNARRTSLPFTVEGATIVLVDRGGRELPIEPTYTGATIDIPRDLSIVLSRDPGGTLSLAVEPLAGVA